jgi:hypothetical protein
MVVDEVFADLIYQFTVLLSRIAVMQVMIVAPLRCGLNPLAGSAMAGEKSGLLVVQVNSL